MQLLRRFPTVPQIQDKDAQVYFEQIKSVFDSTMLDINKWEKEIASGGVTPPLAVNKIFVGNASGIATAVDMSGDATIVASGAVTMLSSAIIAKLLTGYIATAGTISASDSILTAIQKLGYDKHAAFSISSLTGFTLTGQALSYSTGYALPTTSDVAKGVTAYGWGDHASAGYLTTISGLNISSLTNDVPYLSSISGFNVSSLINDSGYLTTIYGFPISYLTNDVPYLSSISGLNISSLINDSGYYKSGDSPTFANITDSGLTSGRIPYASTAGLLVDGANLTYNGTTVSMGRLSLTDGTVTTFSTYKGANADGYNVWFGGGGLSSLGEVGATYKGSYNLGIGTSALLSNTKGYMNYALGTNVLYTNTIGYENTGIGYNVLYYNLTGYRNVAIGTRSMESNYNGYNNVSIGYYAMNSVYNASNDVAIGWRALQYIYDGSNNVALGTEAGRYITNGSTPNYSNALSIYIGYQTRPKADNSTNEIVLGSSTIGNGSNTATWGNTSITDHYFTGKVRATSFSVGTTVGVDGSFTSADGKTITVTKGIITAIV